MFSFLVGTNWLHILQTTIICALMLSRHPNHFRIINTVDVRLMKMGIYSAHIMFNFSGSVMELICKCSSFSLYGSVLEPWQMVNVAYSGRMDKIHQERRQRVPCALRPPEPIAAVRDNVSKPTGTAAACFRSVSLLGSAENTQLIYFYQMPWASCVNLHRAARVGRKSDTETA